MCQDNVLWLPWYLRQCSLVAMVCMLTDTRRFDARVNIPGPRVAGPGGMMSGGPSQADGFSKAVQRLLHPAPCHLIKRPSIYMSNVATLHVMVTYRPSFRWLPQRSAIAGLADPARLAKASVHWPAQGWSGDNYRNMAEVADGQHFKH